MRLTRVEFVLRDKAARWPRWYPTYVSSDNSNKTLTSGDDDGGGISSSYWSYSEGSGYEQISDYGLKVFAYENDGVWVTWIPPMEQLYPSRFG